jgi:hypothetical protein
MGRMSGGILDLIDNALADCAVSPEAMRWNPDPGTSAGRADVMAGDAAGAAGWPAVHPYPGAQSCSAPAGTGFLMLQRVEGGYEGRVYRWPEGFSGSAALEDLEVIATGFYDESGTLVREL